VWNDDTDPREEDVSVGVGVELRLDLVLGYKLEVTPALGIAKGIAGGGETILYLTVYAGL